jgi:hypothetical protein
MPSRHHPTRPGPGYRTGSVADPHIRVSDAERDEVTERLSRHYADGRLDQGEFTLRLGRATAAVTRHDLDGLFADLPRLADEPAPPKERRRRLVPLLLLVVVVGLTVGSVRSLLQIPWLLLVVGLLCWHRWRRHHRASERGR